MSIAFVKASKKQSRARIALFGASGSGKTFTSLALATELAGKDGKVAVIDTERGSAAKYADVFEFDVAPDMEDFGPLNYCKMIRAAEEAKYAVLIIDSLSHAWSGKGGLLEQVDNAKSREKNQFGAWRDATPQHNELIDTILNCRMHVICTMRSKTEYVQEKDDRGNTKIRKVGMAPIQRDGMEYEFDICGEMDDANALTIGKTRCSALARKRIQQPGAELAKTIKAWLTDGAAMVPEAPRDRIGSAAAAEIIGRLGRVGRNVGVLRDRIIAANLGHLAQGDVDQWDGSLRERIESYLSVAEHAAKTAANGHANGTTNGHAAPAAVAPAVAPAPAPAPETAPTPAPSVRNPPPKSMKRNPWPRSARLVPSRPAYWRDRLLAVVAGHVAKLPANHSLKACAVGDLADGLEAQHNVPDAPDAASQISEADFSVLEAKAQGAYRMLISKIEADDPAIDWDAASIPF